MGSIKNVLTRIELVTFRYESYVPFTWPPLSMYKYVFLLMQNVDFNMVSRVEKWFEFELFALPDSYARRCLKENYKVLRLTLRSCTNDMSLYVD